MIYRLGLDLGGTKIEGIVLDDSGREHFRCRQPTEQALGFESILERLHGVYKKCCEAIGDEPHTLGLGTPGAFSRHTGFLKNSNTVCLNGRLRRETLTDLFGRNLEIENDANCFALAEALQGAGRGYSLVFGVILGTGCGGGIIVDGRLRTGLQHIAGEWGHMVIDPAGPECYCGARGCVETLISGGGLEKEYLRQYQRPASLPEIVRRFRAGESDDVKFMQMFFDRFGRALANVINILDPDVVVLGGGVSNIDEIYTQGIEAVRRSIFSDSMETLVLRHALGDSAGVIGAALLGKS